MESYRVYPPYMGRVNTAGGSLSHDLILLEYIL